MRNDLRIFKHSYVKLLKGPELRHVRGIGPDVKSKLILGIKLKNEDLLLSHFSCNALKIKYRLEQILLQLFQRIRQTFRIEPILKSLEALLVKRISGFF